MSKNVVGLMPTCKVRELFARIRFEPIFGFFNSPTFKLAVMSSAAHTMMQREGERWR